MQSMHASHYNLKNNINNKSNMCGVHSAIPFDSDSAMLLRTDWTMHIY